MNDIAETPDSPKGPGSSRPRMATLDHLRKKKRREADVPITLQDDDGEDVQMTLRFRAISSRQYDKLVSEHPPTPKQKDDGAIYNINNFAPALISAVSLDPKLSVEDASELYNSDDWSGGEIGGLFLAALRLCNAGLDVPFTVSG